MSERAGAQITRKAFIQSALILLAFMILAGILTRVVPAGSYTRYEEAGRVLIDPDSYQISDRPGYPVWRWLTAPVEVLWGEDSTLVIVISLFVLMVGGSFAVLESSGILRSALGGIVTRFRDRKYLLLMLISLFFMALGAFFVVTEPISGPKTKAAQWIYGFIIGGLTIVIRKFSSFSAGIMFATLFMNIFAPIMDIAVNEVKGGSKKA